MIDLIADDVEEKRYVDSQVEHRIAHLLPSASTPGTAAAASLETPMLPMEKSATGRLSTNLVFIAQMRVHLSQTKRFLYNFS